VDYHELMSIDKTSQYHYRLGLNQPAGSPTVRQITEMAEAIIRETDGEFLVEVFPESRLGPDPEMFTDLRSGALEFFMAGATLGEVAPTSALPLLPFAFRDSKGRVRSPRWRARRPDSQRAGANRGPRLPSLLAERISSLDDQHAAGSHRRRSRRAQDPQPRRCDCARFLRSIRSGG